LLNNELSPIEDHLDKLDSVISTTLVQHRKLKQED
ncbi:unnamed protein product, partial [marine sediment metagenome]